MQISHNWLCKLCKLKLPFLFSFRLIPPPLKILVDAAFSSNLAYSLLRAISHQVIEEEEGEECRVYRLGGATGWWWGDVHHIGVQSFYLEIRNCGGTWL